VVVYSATRASIAVYSTKKRAAISEKGICGHEKEMDGICASFLPSLEKKVPMCFFSAYI